MVRSGKAAGGADAEAFVVEDYPGGLGGLVGDRAAVVARGWWWGEDVATDWTGGVEGGQREVAEINATWEGRSATGEGGDVFDEVGVGVVDGAAYAFEAVVGLTPAFVGGAEATGLGPFIGLFVLDAGRDQGLEERVGEVLSESALPTWSVVLRVDGHGTGEGAGVGRAGEVFTIRAETKDDRDAGLEFGTALAVGKS